MKPIFGILIFILSASAYAAAPAVVVTAVEGKALLNVNGQETEIQPGAEIPQGAILKSDEKGSVDISIHGNSGFRFFPGTQVAFPITAPEKTKLVLENGNLIARFKTKIEPSATFEVETPTAVLAVRGTQFWGRVVSPGEKPVTSFAVREGVVKITAKASGQSVTLKKGEAVELPANQAPLLRKAETAELSAIAQSETIKI